MSEPPTTEPPRAGPRADLFRNPVGMADAELALMRRRKGRLETVTCATTASTGVFFSMLFIAESSRAQALVWGVGIALAGAAAWWLLRRRRPAAIKEPQLLTTARSVEPTEAREDEEEDDSGWDFTSLLLVITVVPFFVIIGVLFACIVPLMVLAGFLVHAGGASNLMVLTAVVCIVVTNVAVEFAVTNPLARRWGIPLD